MPIIKYCIWFHLYTGQWSYSIYVGCWQKVILNLILIEYIYLFLFFRAPLEEMLQRAGVGAGPNTRGPPVPEGPPVSNAPGGTSGKNYNFTQLP
jgi:hypothetical protein